MATEQVLDIESGPTNEDMIKKVEASATEDQIFLFRLTNDELTKLEGRAKPHKRIKNRYTIVGTIKGFGRCIAFFSPEGARHSKNRIHLLCEEVCCP